MLNSIDAVVVLIIVCAASLAFVVLYNLSNINIAERVKRDRHHQGAGLLRP